MEQLSTIFRRNNTDKGPDYHNYCRQYESLLSNYRDSNIKYLEIGVFNGGSIRAMREAFKNASVIVGLDIDTRCKQYESADDNIFVEIGDATDLSFVKYVTKKYGTFDIILDDGSHINRDCIKTFELLFPLLNDNGLYIVEDTTVYKYSQYTDSKYPNILDYFKKYIYNLNQTRYDSVSTSPIKDFVSDPFKIEKKTSDVFEYSIDKLEFGSSYVAIHKKVKYHWIM
jgi:predicted O-methyltransferase YrrM